MTASASAVSERGVSRPLALLLLLMLMASFVLTRLVLALHAGVASIPLTLWPMAFLRGLLFDAAVAAALMVPVLLYDALLPESWRKSRWHAVLRFVWLWLSIAGLLFFGASEYVFWLEFGSRFNFIALDYLIYTREVLGNIGQSYPMGWITAAIAVVATLLTARLAPGVRRADLHPTSGRKRWAFAGAATAAAWALLSWLTVEQMEGSDNAYAQELSGNGLFTLAAAARRNELDYARFYRSIPEQEAQKILTGLDVERAPDSIERLAQYIRDKASDSKPFAHPPRHLVLVTVESLSASFVGAYGNTQGLTPNLDRLARDGMQFDRLYATGTRTVRGLEALSLGTPPTPGQAIVRRPNIEHLSTIGEVLRYQGFESLFFYGGYGYFDNMNAYFSANDYKVFDRTDIPKERIVHENVWGVADEVLFGKVVDTLDEVNRSGKRFFAHIMTTSNHRPYTYPDGRVDIPSPGGREGAVKYTDYAIGEFIRQASQHPWFKDTLFVFVADHCASASGKTKLPVEHYRIPLIFYAPQLLKPGHYPHVASQVDIVPSLLEALDVHGDDLFFGHSIYEAGRPLERAFISNYQELGYLRNGILTVLMPKQRVQAFRIDPATQEATPTEVDERLLKEAIAYYQTAASEFTRGELKVPMTEVKVFND